MALPPPSPLIHGFEGSSVSPMEDISGEGFCLAFDDPTTSPAIAFDAAVAMAETMTSTTLPPAPAPAPTSPVGRRLPPPSSRMGRQLNSTNSLYVEQCLGTPDHVSLIHMLAHRIHASCSPVEAGQPRAEPFPFRAFREERAVQTDLAAITSFMTTVFATAQMEIECLVAAAVYLRRILVAAEARIVAVEEERLARDPHLGEEVNDDDDDDSSDIYPEEDETGYGSGFAALDGGSTHVALSPMQERRDDELQEWPSRALLGARTWRSVVAAAMVLASKVWDDLSMINIDFCEICGPLFNLRRLNKLEIAFLSAVKFDCQIAAATYARVYFQLRESSPTAALRDLKPLRLEPSVARRLEQNAASLVRSASLDNLGQGRRAKTSQPASVEDILSTTTSRKYGRDRGKGSLEKMIATARLAACEAATAAEKAKAAEEEGSRRRRSASFAGTGSVSPPAHGRARSSSLSEMYERWN